MPGCDLDKRIKEDDNRVGDHFLYWLRVIGLICCNHSDPISQEARVAATPFTDSTHGTLFALRTAVITFGLHVSTG